MKSRNLMKVSTMLSLILLGSSLLGGNAYAKGGVAPVPAPVAVGGGGGGGTAKPPAKNLVAPVFVPTLADPSPAGAPFTVPPGAFNGAGVHGFDATGIIQNAIVDGSGCSGSVTIDNKNIIIPCGLIVQMPANTLKWADFVAGGVPALEITLVGNKVGGTYIAALAFISQELLHSLSGTITSIDYNTGELIVDGITRVQINDPFGRFGRAQSPDARFSVDDQNPTIHAGTGYPMCVPRNIDPTTGSLYPTDNIAGIDHPRDPLCPQHNRPLAAGGCRNFGAAGFAPPASGELTPPVLTVLGVLGQTYCSQYVMKALPGAIVYPTGSPVVSSLVRSVNEADPSQQAPFEVGDFITYSGTVMGTTPISTVGTFISAHTIEANVGIFTQPGTQPAYVAIGGFGIGTADPTPAAVTGVAQESTNRLHLEASTTDFRTPIDIYLVDEAKGGVLSGILNRWVTPWEMTGECPPANGLPAAIGGNAPLATACNGVTGGISTSLTGPQAQRDRIRAVKAPLGLLSQPSRTVRVVQRSLCTPKAAVNNGPGLVDDCLKTASQTANLVANGLVAGQYLAPNFEFIFPENVKKGDIPIPYDIWHLPFIRFGEGIVTPALTPQPW